MHCSSFLSLFELIFAIAGLEKAKNAAGKRSPPDPESAFTTPSMRTCFGVCQNNSLAIKIADPSCTQQFALHPPRTTGIHLVICIHTDI
jgi:hypothetical protein